MDQTKTGNFLKELRNEKKLTQEQLAEHFNVSSRTVSRWETGKNMPDISLLVEIADFYDVDVREIIEGGRKSEMMDKDVKETAGEMAVYANAEKKKLLGFIQIVSLLGLGALAIALFLQLTVYEPEPRRAGAVLASFLGLIIMGVIVLYVNGLLGRLVENKAFVKAVKITALVLFVIPLYSLFVIGAGVFSMVTAKVEVHTDVEEYNTYIHNPSKDIYRRCNEERFDIFPAEITSDMNIREFQFTYYNPWDAQYIMYLTVDYPDADYAEEITRLKTIGQGDYMGIYSVKGAPAGYEIVAMCPDEYYGFVYAMIPMNEAEGSNEITYVGIDFCNYFLDLDVCKYLPDKYLLEGFDASRNNPYMKMKREDL